MERVVVESPYAGETENAIRQNIDFARLCLMDCLRRGEAPFASHLLYTQPTVLDDSNPDERTKGMDAGFEWGSKAEKVVVYIDRGISSEMRQGIEYYSSMGMAVEFRRLNAKEKEGK